MTETTWADREKLRAELERAGFSKVGSLHTWFRLNNAPGTHARCGAKRLEIRVDGSDGSVTRFGGEWSELSDDPLNDLLTELANSDYAAAYLRGIALDVVEYAAHRLNDGGREAFTIPQLATLLHDMFRTNNRGEADPDEPTLRLRPVRTDEFVGFTVTGDGYRMSWDDEVWDEESRDDSCPIRVSVAEVIRADGAGSMLTDDELAMIAGEFQAW